MACTACACCPLFLGPISKSENVLNGLKLNRLPGSIPSNQKSDPRRSHEISFFSSNIRKPFFSQGLFPLYKCFSHPNKTLLKQPLRIRSYKNSEDSIPSEDLNTLPSGSDFPQFENDFSVAWNFPTTSTQKDAPKLEPLAFPGRSTPKLFKTETTPTAINKDEKFGKVGQYVRHGNVNLASFTTADTECEQRTTKNDSSKTLSRMLPVTVLATAIIALLHPPSFSWFSKKYYAPALGGIMLSIGIQLTFSDFHLVLKQPRAVLIGFLCQYILKPVIALAVVSAFRVPAAFSLGLLLTASVSGAQLSSYAAYLADGDVALSIVLTSITTITSVALTPIFTKLLIGSVVPIDLMCMASSIMQVVVFPIALGLLLNTYAKDWVDRVRHVMPLLAMTCTSLCIGSPLSLNSSTLLSAQGLQLLLPILAFHMAAFTLGYWFSKLPFWRQDEKSSKTISLCTGMQSSTLAMLLASQFLGLTQTVPPACSVVVMALMGLSIGAFWGTGASFTRVFYRFQGPKCQTS